MKKIAATILALIFANTAYSKSTEQQIQQCQAYLNELNQQTDVKRKEAIVEFLKLPIYIQKKERLNIDSLAQLSIVEPLIKKMTSNHLKAETFVEFTKAATELGNKEQAFNYLTQAEKTIEQIEPDYAYDQPIFLKELAKVAAQLGDDKKTVSLLRDSEKNYNVAYINVYQTLAETLFKQGDQEKALYYLTQIQAAAEKEQTRDHDEKYLAELWQHLASMAIALDAKDKALSYLNLAQPFAQKIRYEYNTLAFLQKQAELTLAAGDKDKATEYFNQMAIYADKIADKTSSEKKGSFKYLIETAAALGDTEKALFYLTQAQKLSEETLFSGSEAFFSDLIKAAEKFSDKEKALIYLEQLQSSADKNHSIKDNIKMLKNVFFQLLAEAAAKAGDKNKALAYLDQVKPLVEEWPVSSNMGAYLKTTALQMLADTSVNIGDKKNALLYLTQAVSAASKMQTQNFASRLIPIIAETLLDANTLLGEGYPQQEDEINHFIDNNAKYLEKYTWPIIFRASAELNARKGNYEYVCNLAKADMVDNKLLLVAIALREYQKKNSLSAR